MGRKNRKANTVSDITINDVIKRSLIHGRLICDSVLNYYDNKLPAVKVDEDVKPVTVVGRGQNVPRPGTIFNFVLTESNITNNQIEIIEVEKYYKFFSKIDGLMDYITNNYNKLPRYILYMDGFDTLIINDFNNPKELLDFYGCKVLFNSTPGFWGTGRKPPIDDENYFQPLFTKIKDELLGKSQVKYNFTGERGTSLNAGVFFGEKDFILKMLNETHHYMHGDPNKGFPYGTDCDQQVLKFLHNKYFDDISIDFYNKISIWGSTFNFKNDVS